jgi:hypothetical protein
MAGRAARVSRLIGFGIATTVAGCYTLEPATAPVPALVGTQVAFDINDAGRVALGGSMGPEIGQVEGRLVAKDSTDYLIAVSTVRLLRGGEQVWRGEEIRIKSEYVSSVYERRYSRGRSIALSAIGAGLAAAIATRGIIGGGQDDPRKPPTDSIPSARPRRP